MNALIDFKQNLSLVLGSLILRPIPPGAMVVSLGQVVLAVFFCGTGLIAVQFYMAGPESRFEIWGVTTLAAQAFGGLSAIAVGILLLRQSRLIIEMVVGTILALTLGLIISAVLTAPLSTWLGIAHPYIQFTQRTLPIALFAFALLPGRWWGRIVCSTAFSSAVIVMGLEVSPSYPMFTAFSDDDGEEEYSIIDVEALYYAQSNLLAHQISGLPAQDPNQIDLYGLALAGYAYQGVFLREIDAVTNILTQHHAPKGSILRLANSAPEPMRYPLANGPNLEISLRSLANTMDVNQDIAFLFLTSHGSRNELSLSFWDAQVNTMTADRLADILDSSGLKNIVLMISACHSGSFIDELYTRDRMIITAAAADKTSFGCSNENEWTWWGRAYFDEALRETSDFRKTFDLARDLVREWEAEANVTPSNPQIFVGDRIGIVLDKYFAAQTVINEASLQAPTRPRN